MIKATIVRSPEGMIIGFSVRNHGESIVCAAVSMLVLNTVNSIETFTDADFSCEYQEEGGYLAFSLSSVGHERASLLLDAMYLGLSMAGDEYPDEISLMEV